MLAWTHHIQLIFSLAQENLSWKTEFCIYDNIIQADKVLVIPSDNITTVQKEQVSFEKVYIFVGKT